jgi:hypothetical protein
MAYQSIKDPGKNNKMGGFKQKLFLAPLSVFLALQKPDAGKFVITTAHTFGASEGFIELYITKNTGSVKIDPMGGPDRKSFKAVAKGFHPGESDALLALINEGKNDRWILLGPLAGSDELIQIGNDEFQAELKATYDTTENEGDGRGTTLEFECYMADIVKYRSTVTVKPVA